MRTLLQRLVLPALIMAVVAAGLAATAPARAAVIPIPGGACPVGKAVGTQNIVVNGDFSQGPTGFESALIIRDSGEDGLGILPDATGGGGLSIQRGFRIYNGGNLVGRPFPGDPAREVPPSETYFYSNPQQRANGQGFFYADTTVGNEVIKAEELDVLWRQTVPVVPNATYNFYAYIDNILAPRNNANDPVIELRVSIPGEPASAIRIGEPITVTKVPDEWVPIEFAFQTAPGQTEATLAIFTVAGRYYGEDAVNGDDFGITAINLRPCADAIGIAKRAAAPVRNSDGTFDVTYSMNLVNYGAATSTPATNLQVTDDLGAAFANARSFSIRSLTSTPNITLNPNYDGRVNLNMLSGADTFDPGETATITLTVRVTPGGGFGGLGPFLNTAVVTAIAQGIPIEDDSGPGAQPDLDGNGNPKGPGEDEPTAVSFGARVGLPLLRKP